MNVELPNDWEMKRLRDVAKINSESIPAKTHSEDSFYYQDLSTVENGRLTRATESVCFLEAPSRARRKASQGDIAMSTVRPYLKGFARVDFNPKEFVFSTGFAIVSPKCREDSEFIYQNLFSGYFDYQFYANLVGSNYPALNSSDVSAFRIPYPESQEERIYIGSILRDFDKAIETQERLIAQKQQRMNGLMLKLLAGKVRFPEFKKTPWRESKLDAVLKHVFRPISWRPDMDLKLVSIRRRAGGLFLRPEMKGSDYKTSDLHEIRKGDFLISKRQVTHGALAVVKAPFDGCHVSKEYTIFENTAPNILHTPFLDWLAKTREMWHKAYVASNGVAIEKLIFVPKDFLKFEIKLPPTLEEQIPVSYTHLRAHETRYTISYAV